MSCGPAELYCRAGHPEFAIPPAAPPAAEQPAARQQLQRAALQLLPKPRYQALFVLLQCLVGSPARAQGPIGISLLRTC